MSNIVDNTFFYGHLTIPQVTQISVQNELAFYIDEYERDFLLSILGYGLYQRYLAVTPPTDPQILAILNGAAYTNRSGYPTAYKGLSFTLGSAKKSPIANYVYCKYLMEHKTTATGTGEKTTQGTNSVPSTNNFRFSRAWNQMVDMNWDLLDFLVTNLANYPEFKQYYALGNYRGWPYYNPQGGGDGDYLRGMGSSDLQRLFTRVNPLF